MLKLQFQHENYSSRLTHIKYTAVAADHSRESGMHSLDNQLEEALGRIDQLDKQLDAESRDKVALSQIQVYLSSLFFETSCQNHRQLGCWPRQIA